MKTKIKKVLTIGGATIDNIIRYEQMESMTLHKPNKTENYLLLEEGGKIEVSEQDCFTGGGATNTAICFKQLGYDVSLFVKIGQDASGEMLMSEMTQYGVDISNVRYSKTHHTATSFVVPSLKGDRTVFAYRGANTDLLSLDLPESAIVASDFIYITSLSKNSAARLPEIVAMAQSHDVKVAINPGASQLVRGSGFVKEALYGVDILTLNYEEAQQLMVSLESEDENENENKVEVRSGRSKKIKQVELHKMSSHAVTFSLKHFCLEVIKLGVRIVVVTDGEKGVYVASEKCVYFHPALKVSVTNTLGAGDAFASTFVAWMYSGEEIEASIYAGLINSASVIQYPDAKSGLKSLEELRKAVASMLECSESETLLQSHCYHPLM